jgi:hypothetical protein
MHRFVHRFHPLRYSCILHSIVVCPLQVLKRGIAFPIHRPSVSKSSTPSSPSSLSSPQVIHRVIHRLILVVWRLQVLKGGIVSPIHVSSLVVQPRGHYPHFIEFAQVTSRIISQSILSLANKQCSDWAGLGRYGVVSHTSPKQGQYRPSPVRWDRTRAQPRWAGLSDETGPAHTGLVCRRIWTSPYRPDLSSDLNWPRAAAAAATSDQQRPKLQVTVTCGRWQAAT